MPIITARVVNPFKEKAHNGHYYEAGDVYPAEGFEADEKRIYFLTDVHPKYKKIYLADITIHEDEVETVLKIEGSDVDEKGVIAEGFPKSTGGGWYLLSNGEKAQGKDEAQEAQDKLNRGE